jgi:hypothetical protein
VSVRVAGRPVPFVGDAVALVGDAVAVIRGPLALVSCDLGLIQGHATLGQVGLEGLLGGLGAAPGSSLTVRVTS